MTRATMHGIFSAVLMIACLACVPSAAAQESEADSLRARVAQLETDVHGLKTRLDMAYSEIDSLHERFYHISSARYVPAGALLFTIAVFCALWAQNTGRNVLGWFVLGFFLHGIAMLAMLMKNASDRRRDTPPAAPVEPVAAPA